MDTGVHANAHDRNEHKIHVMKTFMSLVKTHAQTNPSELWMEVAMCVALYVANGRSTSIGKYRALTHKALHDQVI